MGQTRSKKHPSVLKSRFLQTHGQKEGVVCGEFSSLGCFQARAETDTPWPHVLCPVFQSGGLRRTIDQSAVNEPSNCKTQDSVSTAVRATNTPDESRSSCCRYPPYPSVLLIADVIHPHPSVGKDAVTCLPHPGEAYHKCKTMQSESLLPLITTCPTINARMHGSAEANRHQL